MNFVDLFAWLEDFSGRSVVDFILFLASSLTDEDMPGWVSLVLFLLLVGLSLCYHVVTRRFVGAVRSVRAILRVEGDGKITRDRLVDIDREFAQARARCAHLARLERAWREFNETALPPVADSAILHS